HFGDECRVASVPRFVDDHQVGARPNPLELPRVADGRLEIESPVDEDAGDAGKRAGAAQQAAVLEESVVADVVGDEASEAQGKLRVFESLVKAMLRWPVRRGGLPRAPVEGGLRAD